MHQGRQPIPTARQTDRACLVAVSTTDGDANGKWALEDSLAELRDLARTAGVEVVGEATQQLSIANPATLIGKGKVTEVRHLAEAALCNVVIFSNDLSPAQQRNLEDALGVRVVDRTGLILDIFAQRARTHEGRLQVELAQYEYFLPRLAGLWPHLSRQAVGGVGLRGPGETQLESDRRRIRKRIVDLRRELESVRAHRSLYRERRHKEDIPVASIVGYTNAGKSTLLNAFTDAGVLAEDRLFATLDPTTRRASLPGGGLVLLTDTVGFVQRLPVQLVAAFRATLEELKDADLLLHVVDISHKNAPEQVDAVQRILAELGVGETPTILVLNKADKLVPAGRDHRPESLADLQYVAAKVHPQTSGLADAVVVSALQRWGLHSLLAKMEEVLTRSWSDIRACLPYAASELVSLVHEWGVVKAERYEAQGIAIEARVPRRVAARLQPFAEERSACAPGRGQATTSPGRT